VPAAYAAGPVSFSLNPLLALVLPEYKNKCNRTLFYDCSKTGIFLC
jgi:hypothetical protein